MAKKRTTKKLLTGITAEQAEQAFADYATADANLQAATAKMDKEMTTIRKNYTSDLLSFEESKDRNFEILQAYAMEHPELFTKKKSIDSTHGTYGFRTGTPKLASLKGFTWPAITNLLKIFLPGYVRTAEEAAKDKLLADRALEGVRDQLAKCGIRVEQTETFFVELKKEDAPETC